MINVTTKYKVIKVTGKVVSFNNKAKAIAKELERRGYTITIIIK
jgi:hypothetical protein